MTAQEIATMVVSRLLATVGRDTAKTRLAVPARKLARAALIRSSQLTRAPIRRSSAAAAAAARDSRPLIVCGLFTNAAPPDECRTPEPPRSAGAQPPPGQPRAHFESVVAARHPSH